MIKMFRKNEGIIYLGTVIMVMVLFGLMSYTLSNLLVISNGKTANLYLDTQAELAAITGIEYAFYNLLEDFANWSGTTDSVTFGKSKFLVAVYTTDEDGAALPSDERRVVSTGITEQSVKQVQVHFSSTSEAFSFAIYVDALEDPSNDVVTITSNNTLKGDLYFGVSVDVRVPRVNIDTTTIYIPSGYMVTSSPAEFDDTYQWKIYSPPLPTFPDFDTSVHDSLLAIASAITVTDTSGTGNEFYGDFLVNDAFTLADYTNSTLFINGNLIVHGSNGIITSLTTQNPGYFVVNGRANFKAGCNVGDNIITIASGDVQVTADDTRYGVDWSDYDPPTRVNELFSYTNVVIRNATVSSAIESLGDISIRATTYSSCYSAGSIEIRSAIFKGSVVTKMVTLDRFADSELEFVPPLPVTATGSVKPTIIPGSWKML